MCVGDSLSPLKRVLGEFGVLHVVWQLACGAREVEGGKARRGACCWRLVGVRLCCCWVTAVTELSLPLPLCAAAPCCCSLLLPQVNLICFNPFDGTRFRPSCMSDVLAFRSVLIQGGRVCTIRDSRGDDEMAACGQLGNPLLSAKSAPILEPPERFRAALTP